ncbi:hypothetical protein QMG83_12270 [Salinibacterium sp. G-O1]|uniref:hypothetical protein n=1 Tax=Salinibacterium sp. G-O1 TaxID=3046208 RepID=UPI0024B8BD64|nr:hypothetical protein [Salinibacterium sp. G-O1]MDJ0336001.1 hypothetical protein [Salinibacterium sp. G-O1]
MKPPEEEETADSHGAEERLRQYLQSRLPADQVEEALRKLQLDTESDEVTPQESMPLDDSVEADRDGGESDRPHDQVRNGSN